MVSAAFDIGLIVSLTLFMGILATLYSERLAARLAS